MISGRLSLKSGVEMEAGSCALSQGNAKCGLSGGAVDTLNVEHELSRWLQDLDAASSTMSTRTASSARKPPPPKVASKPCTSPVITNSHQQQQPTVSDKVTEAAFEAILGQLSSLDSLFDSVDDAAIVHSSAPGVATSPTPPRSATHHHHQHTPSNTDPVRGHQTTASSSGQLDGCEDVLRGALLELNTIAANSPSPPLPPGVDSSVSAAATTTSTLQNGHAQLAAPGGAQNGHVSSGGHRRSDGTTDDDPTSSSSSSSLVTIASDKSQSSVRNGGSSSPGAAGNSVAPSLTIKPAQTPVQVFLPDGASSHVMVDEQLSTDHLCELMMKRRNVPMMTSWSILEQLPELFIERRIERHEMVLDVVRNWVKGSSNRLVFVENGGRYALYDTDHQGLLVDSVYDVQGQLHVKADDKKTWRRLDCVLQKSGLCCMTTSTGGGGGKQQAQQQRHAAEMKCLQSLSDVDIYLSLDWRKKHKSPSEHGIALKPGYVQKKTPKCIKYLCCEDEATMVRWVTALRLAKYGEHLTRVSRGPELSREHHLAVAPQLNSSLTGSTTPSCGVETPACSAVEDLQLTSGSSTIRRKVLVPALPITTQTTRLLSQQSRSAGDDIISETPQQQQQQSVHTQRTANQLPTPPTSANTTTTTLDSRMPPPHGLSQIVENGSPQTATKPAYRQPSAAAASLPLDHGLPSPPTSANTVTATTLDSRPTTHRLPTAATTLPRDLPSAIATTTTTGDTPIPLPPSNVPADSAANRTYRPTANGGQGTPTRTASARSADAPGHGSPARPKPAPPKRSETTKLSAPPDPRQTKAFIMNLDRVISLKNCKGSAGLATLPVPLPPRPNYIDGPTYLDTDDLPPPPAELLEGLRSMRRQGVPLPPIPAPGRR